MKKFVSWCCVLLMLMGCAPKEFKPFEPPNLSFEKTAPYSVDLSFLEKVEDLEPIFVDENYNEVPLNKAKYAVLVPEEYKKVAIMKKAFLTSQKLLLEQEKLINQQVDIINNFKELVELERQKTQTYRDLWVNSENAYRQEAYQRRMDDLQNKALWVLVIAGAVIAVGLSL